MVTAIALAVSSDHNAYCLQYLISRLIGSRLGLSSHVALDPCMAFRAVNLFKNLVPSTTRFSHFSKGTALSHTTHPQDFSSMPPRGTLMLTEDETELILDGLPPPGTNEASNNLRARLTGFLREIRGASDNSSNIAEKPTEKYRNPALTVDAAVVRGRKENLELLLITRGRPPFQGQLAFPGGFVDYGEDPKDAVIRELQEECGIQGVNPKLVAVRGHPKRDNRKHIVTICYHVQVPDSASVQAGDDAAQCGWYPIENLIKDSSKLAFDHDKLLGQFVNFLEVNASR